MILQVFNIVFTFKLLIRQSVSLRGAFHVFNMLVTKGRVEGEKWRTAETLISVLFYYFLRRSRASQKQQKRKLSVFHQALQSCISTSNICMFIRQPAKN